MPQYNSSSRRIEWKLDIFMDGPSAPPLEVLRDNYLISSELLEEVNSSSDTPWGDVSANELTAVLHNRNDMFNPSNLNSPYYGKIKTGLMVKCYVRSVSTEEWESLGTFYVVDWVTQAGGLTAELTCYDKISDIIGAADVKMKVWRNIAVKEFIRKFFTALDIDAVIDDSLDFILPYGYHVGTNKTFLNNISEGIQAFIFCDHTGTIKVQYMRKILPIAHTITDNDQIVEISAQQSLTHDYDGIQVILKTPQLSADTVILDIKGMNIPAEGIEVEAQAFALTPVAMITMAHILGDYKAHVNIPDATSRDFNYVIENEEAFDFMADVKFHGRIIEVVNTEYTDEGNNLLKMDNIYVQTPEQFEIIKQFLSMYVVGITPILEIKVRGNPQFELGQKIHVESTRFNTSFDGVLIRQQLQYNGGLSGTITLLNSRLLEVI